MKKILSIILMLGMVFTAKAITLFPFFVDVAGDYHDGVMGELVDASNALEDNFMYSSKPSFYSNLAEADAFYNDVMPFSTEEIMVKEYDLEVCKGKIYISPMLDGKTAYIYLIELPDQNFFIAYNER